MGTPPAQEQIKRANQASKSSAQIIEAQPLDLQPNIVIFALKCLRLATPGSSRKDWSSAFGEMLPSLAARAASRSGYTFGCRCALPLQSRGSFR